MKRCDFLVQGGSTAGRDRVRVYQSADGTPAQLAENAKALIAELIAAKWPEIGARLGKD